MNNEVEAGLLYEGRSNLLKFVVPDGVAVDLKEKSFRVRTPLKGFGGSLMGHVGVAGEIEQVEPCCVAFASIVDFIGGLRDVVEFS